MPLHILQEEGGKTGQGSHNPSLARLLLLHRSVARDAQSIMARTAPDDMMFVKQVSLEPAIKPVCTTPRLSLRNSFIRGRADGVNLTCQRTRVPVECAISGGRTRAVA